VVEAAALQHVLQTNGLQAQEVEVQRTPKCLDQLVP
jgi:hypothetical protein